MDLHDLILITAAFVAGFCTCYLLRVWADHRAKPFKDRCAKAEEFALKCQLNEAFRIGQEQGSQRIIEAPAPYQF